MHDEVYHANLIVDVEYFLPALTTVCGFENTSFVIRSKEMAG